ncbi:MAG: HNH endonuclease [Candidatus Dormibacteraeota bacterium]|nr:HNH endonuclease [Candidatus Dormibacteraeota bacterium]
MSSMAASAWGSPLDEVTQSIAALVGEDTRHLPSLTQAERLKQIRQGINRLEAQFTTELRVFDQQQGSVVGGHQSLQGWLRRNCQFSSGAGADRIRLGRQLEELPHTAAAFQEGRLSAQHVGLVGRSAGQVGTEALQPAEADLVRWGGELDTWEFRHLTHCLRHCLDPEGAQADANALHEKRHLGLAQSWQGLYFLEGQLDEEGGELVRTALDAIEGAPQAGDSRSKGERRADALVELARRQLDGGTLPERAGQKPHLHLVCECGTLRQEPGTPPAELNGEVLVPRETVRRYGCDALLTVERKGERTIVKEGHACRVVTPSLRRALKRRDGGCRFPDCDRPPEWTDAHHVLHWADGGHTKLENLLLLCRRHHRRVLEEGWRVSRAEGGGWRFTSPAGEGWPGP